MTPFVYSYNQFLTFFHQMTLFFDNISSKFSIFLKNCQKCVQICILPGKLVNICLSLSVWPPLLLFFDLSTEWLLFRRKISHPKTPPSLPKLSAPGLRTLSLFTDLHINYPLPFTVWHQLSFTIPMFWSWSCQYYMLAMVSKILMSISSQNPRGYLKNYWTNTRLVCTLLDAFFILSSNMAMKIWIWKNLSLNIFVLSSALDICVEKVNSDDNCLPLMLMLIFLYKLTCTASHYPFSV